MMTEWMPLADYAALHGLSVSAVNRQILRGKFEEGDIVKVASRWFVRKDTPYPYDNRVTTGDYIGAERARKDLKAK